MKQWISLLLALVLSLALALPAGAAPPEQEEAAAWQLYYMGLFQGTDTDAEGFPVFSLDRSPTRAQGVTMLVRLLGQEEDALAGTWTTPFQDVPDWAAPYVGYAYEKGLTNGKSETRFDPDSTIRASEYLTFVLRALGYVSGTDFAWDSAWTLSDKLGITHGEYNASTTSFDRGDVAWISVRALPAPCKDSEQTLEELLADRGIQYNAGRCTWEEECVTCQKDKMVFSLTPTRESKEVYTSFEVTSATANGLPCEIEQYPTAAKVKEQCQKISRKEDQTVTLPDAFSLVYLRYDEAAAKEAAEALTQSRLKGFAAMNKQMKAALEFLNMPGIRFALKHARGPLSSHGQDTVEFLISTNPGEEPKPLAKIASGGELSRIMLAFKSALADRDALPTVIYDEIDTGVSGLAAGRIGQLLHQTARGHQVLCITHTPQVAAFADNQLLIQKNVRKDRTFTEIHTLDMDGRVEVLARMISGDKVSELSLASARELIEKSK